MFYLGDSKLKKQIAQSLESAFSRLGFAEPSVAQLKGECGVSLRTLYKHYPSKEEMIVAALEHRHRSYLEFLKSDAPNKGKSAIQHIFQKLEVWMEGRAPNGCMSMNALAAFPENIAVIEAVKKHKQEVREWLSLQSGQPGLATDLFVLHEGVSGAWAILGKEAVKSALQQSNYLFERN